MALFLKSFYRTKFTLMKKIFILLMLLPFASFAMPQDSIGTKTENGIVYVMHKIDKGQTLYAIARKYGVDANEIIKANPGSEKGIQADAVILIPTKRRAQTPSTTTQTPPTPKPSAPSGQTQNDTKYHIVKPGETLYKIATTYGVSVEDIKKWNNMDAETISVDQKLAVSQPAASIAIPSTPKPVTPTTTIPVPTKPPVNTDTPVVITTETTNAEVVNIDVEGNPSNEETTTPAVPTRQIRTIGDEVVETGKVEVSSEGDLNQERNFILHPTAKIGTIVMITNPETGKSAFARVVGNYKAPADQVVKINLTLAKKLGITENTKEIRVNYAR